MLDQNCGKTIGVNKILYVCGYKDKDGHKLYHTKCLVCGFEADKRLSNIKKYTSCRGHTIVTQNNETQYVASTSSIKNKTLQNVFRQIKQRCYNPNNADYVHYGGKGIKVCEEWEKDPASFEKWAYENGYQKGLTIDRIHSDKDYCPDNCHWITLQDNARFKSTTRVITIDGISKSGRQWSEYIGHGPNYINTLIRNKGEEAAINYIKSKIQTIPVQKNI